MPNRHLKLNKENIVTKVDNKPLILAVVIFFAIVVFVGIPAAMSPTVQIWTSEGTFHWINETNDNGTTISYVQDQSDPLVTFVATSDLNNAYFPAGQVQENQKVSMFRVFVKTKTKQGMYYTWIFPRWTTERTFSFQCTDCDQNQTITVENFDYVIVWPDRTVSVYTDDTKNQSFTNGTWSVISFWGKPLTVSDSNGISKVKTGLGHVCHEGVSDCFWNDALFVLDQKDFTQTYSNTESVVQITP